MTAIQACDDSPDAPIVGFVSKVFAIPNDQLVLDLRLASGVASRQPRQRNVGNAANAGTRSFCG